jgi:16S rRNA A1518/A1519 N6-dimethyltransferase RsmA/KsgA/DIM1 with predicted DNA glycosylase/AP lyase activity
VLPPADPAYEQHFLVAADKLALLTSAAGIRGADHVVEVGAGAGTVAERLPPCRRLTLIELDDRLVPVLRRRFPEADVRQGDALTLLPGLSADVLIGNLPWAVTGMLVPLLPHLPYRTVVLAIEPTLRLDALRGDFTIDQVAELAPDDFQPRQPSPSSLIRLSRKVDLPG